MSNTNPFADLESELGDATMEVPTKGWLEHAARVKPTKYTKLTAKIYTENCKKCGGSGYYHGYSSHGRHCFECGGKGVIEYKSSPEQRAKNKSAYAAKKVKAIEDKRLAGETYLLEHPNVKAWIESNPGFGFAVSIQQAIYNYGALTYNQLAAVERCIIGSAERVAKREAERMEAVANAPSVDATRLELAFKTAMANGLQYPKIKLDNIKISPASATGKNAGALYVKAGDEYLGKVIGGKFLKVGACSIEQAQIVADLINDPIGYAEAYGKRTGVCCCCGRPLTKGVSIDRGIGPICAEKFGW